MSVILPCRLNSVMSCFSFVSERAFDAMLSRQSADTVPDPRFELFVKIGKPLVQFWK